MKTISFSIITLLLLISCSKETLNNKEPELDCSNVLPPPNSFEINLVNSVGNPLIGSIYTQDSFRLYNNSFEKFIRPPAFGVSTVLQIFYPDIESGIEYFIELDSLDNDTLMFNYSIKNRECFDSFKMDSIKFNGKWIFNYPYNMEKE
ncbi:MAG: hypothetical protein QMB65_01170 [Vicingaceae bacterium]